jgi:hypothetical protein
MQHDQEIANIKARYERRSEVKAELERLYNPLNACNALQHAELHVGTAGFLNHWLGATRKLRDCVIAEIGCGTGRNLISMIRFGANPSRLLANELLPEHIDEARQRLPEGVRFYAGD